MEVKLIALLGIKEIKLKSINESKLTNKLIKDFIDFGFKSYNPKKPMYINMVIHGSELLQNGYLKKVLEFELRDNEKEKDITKEDFKEVILTLTCLECRSSTKEKLLKKLMEDSKLKALYEEKINNACLPYIKDLNIGDIIIADSETYSIKGTLKSMPKNKDLVKFIDKLKKEHKMGEVAVKEVFGSGNHTFEVVNYLEDKTVLRLTYSTLALKDLEQSEFRLRITTKFLDRRFRIVERGT